MNRFACFPRPSRRAGPAARAAQSVPSFVASFAPLLAALTCGAAHGANVELAVTDGSGKPLADAVVYLESKEARAAVKPLAAAEVAQAGRKFVPQVLVVPVGTPVSFPNRDTVRHHVYSLSPVKNFEIKLYVGTPAQPVVFDKPGVAVLGCNIHDTMVAWTVIVETPWYGLTGANGRVTIADVPPGSYRLRSWHPSLPTGAPAQDEALAVAAGGASASVKLAGAAP